MKEEEFEDIFGNVPFENIKKIQKYIEDNYVSLDLYNKEKEKNKELDYKNAHEFRQATKERDAYWENKIKERIDGKFREAKGLYERGVQPQAQYTMKLLRELEEKLLNKEE